MSCSISTITNRTQGFDFALLLPVHQYLNQTCPLDSDIFFQGTRMLTEAVCRKITGTSNSLWSGWTPYPIADIWTRIVTWKLPLFQLVSQFPRAPLGFSVESAVIVHLLGDPVDSITSMLLTLAMCHSRAQRAKQACSTAGLDSSGPEYERVWKALAIAMVSYDECGKPDEAEAFCQEYLRLRAHPEFEEEIRHIYEESANCLAADRQTKSLPVVLAELFFIGGWLIALIKAAASDPNPTNWPNVEAHSVAFSGLYLWATSAVVVGAVIGSSQTEDSIPRLLQGFEYDLAAFQDQTLVRRPSAISREESVWCKVGKERAIHGGLHSWRPRKWTARSRDFNISTWKLASFVGVAIVVVSASFLTAIILSYFVTPRGPSCRHIPEALMLVIWLLSFVVECIFERWLRQWLFWAVFSKDLFFALSNIAIVVITQWGIMNRCSCWSMWDLTGLHLPQLPDVAPELMNYIRHVAPWITFMAILFQLVFCAAVTWRYWDAVRVYIQRDDGLSNRKWRKPKQEATKDGKEDIPKSKQEENILYDKV